MYKAYKYRLQPNTEQQVALAKSFGACRWYWNYSLNLCQETYNKTGKGLSRGYIQGLLPGLKKEYPWLTDAYSIGFAGCCLEPIHRLQKLFR